MRLLVLALAVALPAGSAAAPAPDGNGTQAEFVLTRPVAAIGADKCRKVDTHLADRRGRTEFRKLGELPPATAYMAVLRTDKDGCVDPLTVVEYRTGRR